jgi:CheY-like chemotaxis protein
VAFSVRDTGIGIPASQLGTIFEEFTQADASMTRRYGGTGLGLTIARRLVAAMGGDLTVTSVVGRGSEFAFTIPCVVAPATEHAPAGALAGRRALIVDDNATNRRILREMLASAAIVVSEAASVDEGLEALRQAQAAGRAIELVVIDAQMPDRDGFDFAAAVQADAALAGLRLLMLTSAGQRGDAQRCRDLAIGGYLSKPIPRIDLLEGVAAVLRDEPLSSSSVITRHTIAESRRQLRILLAEDNPVNQEVAATMLRRRGHHVDVVGDGRAAVEAVRGSRYDVVLMDVQMPVLDGFAATQEIRALPGGEHLPIIALTAHALSGERERCLAQGMSGYLAKPFQPGALFATVEAAASDGGPVGDGVAAVVGEPAASPASVDVTRFRRELQEANAEDALDSILDSFVASVPERLGALVAADASGDAAAIQRAAHAYKSSAGAIRANELAEMLQTVESAADGGDVTRARQGIAEVRGESQRVLDYLLATRGHAAS